jgi:hypothetical protein
MAPDMDVEGRTMKGNSAASYLRGYLPLNLGIKLPAQHVASINQDEKESTQCFTRARGPIGGSWRKKKTAESHGLEDGGWA